MAHFKFMTEQRALTDLLLAVLVFFIKETWLTPSLTLAITTPTLQL